MLQRLHTLRPEPRGVVGDWTTTRIKEALEKTPLKLVEAWCKEHLPISV